MLSMKLILICKWDKEEGLRLIKTEKITMAGGVPSVVMDLLEVSDLGKSTLETYAFGGSPASENITKDSFAQGIEP